MRRRGKGLSIWDQSRVFGTPANWDRVDLELGQPRILEDGFLYTTGVQTTTGRSADTAGQTTGWTWPDGAEGATTHPKTSKSETGGLVNWKGFQFISTVGISEDWALCHIPGGLCEKQQTPKISRQWQALAWG